MTKKTQRYRLTIEYDGTNYAGWQRQNDQPTVQEALMNAIYHFCRQRVNVVGAGRTDSGVHATAQVAHIDIDRKMDGFKVMQGINYYLFNPPISQENMAADFNKLWPENRIAVLDAKAVGDDFDARFSAIRRHYMYRIINRRQRLALEEGRAWHVIEELDDKKMQEAANILVGHHDFTSFRDTMCQSKSPEKTLEKLDIIRRGNEIHITASARSFLHHQVRNMVGTLSLVGKGKWQVEDVRTALEAKDRKAGGPTCPASGLYFIGVDY
ncbi:MAG: tRNA pseudouridine(38-40) synthase TruA [Rickettsiales bacterium]